MNLFRDEVSAAEPGRGLGSVVLMRPASTNIVMMFAVLTIISLITASSLLHYSSHVELPGMITSDKGIIKVFSPQTGVIIRQAISEGQFVRKGQTLYVISSERQVLGMGNGSQTSSTSKRGLSALERRRHALSEQGKVRSAMSKRQQQEANLQATIASRELTQLNIAVQLQRKRVKSAADEAQTYEKLAREDLIASVTAQQKMNDSLDQQSRLVALERDRQSVIAQISTLKSDTAKYALQGNAENLDVEGNIADLDRTLASAEEQGEIVITAPVAGVITAISTSAGQTVTNAPMVSIIPLGTKFKAQLYASGKASGSIVAGQRVNLRFEAFPSQQYGKLQGTVESVSRTSLAPDEVPGQMGLALQQKPSEGYYRVDVALASQSIGSGARERHLRSGLELKASILQNRRRVISWMSEPLLNAFGSIK